MDPDINEYTSLDISSSASESKQTCTENDKLISTSTGSDDTKILSNFRQNALLITLLVIHYFLLCSDSILYPFFAAAAKRKGLVDTQIGFVYSSYEIVRCVAAPLYGVLISILKPREMCFIGSLSCGISLLLFGLIYYAADHWFFPLCLIIRILAGNGSVMFTVAMTSGLMKATTFKSTTIIAAMEGSLAAGYTSGPLIGAGLYQIGGYSLSFLVTGTITTLLSFALLLTVPSIEETSQTKAGVKEFFKIISIPGVFLSGFRTTAMTKFGSNIVYSFAAGWLITEFGLSQTLTTTFYIVPSLTYGLVCYPISKVISKGFVWSVLVVPMAINCLLFIIFTPKVLQIFFPSVQYEWWYPVIIFGVHVVMYCPLLLAPYEASLHLSSVNGYDADSLVLHGMLAGVVNSGLNFGAALSPMISGVITEKLGYEWNSILSASVFFIMTLLYIIYLLMMKYSGKPLRLLHKPIIKRRRRQLTD